MNLFSKKAFTVLLVSLIFLTGAKSQIQNIATIPESTFGYNLNMVHHNPGEAPFVTKYNDPSYLKSIGMNGQVPRIFLPCAVDYDIYYPEQKLIPTALKKKIDAYGAHVDSIIKKAKAASMPIYPFTDLLVLPKVIVDKYGKEMAAEEADHGIEVLGGTRFNASIMRKRTQEILRAQLESIFTRFPDIDGLVCRFGETYLHEFPDYAGGTPAQTPEELTVLVNLLRDEICVKRNKKVFFRTWGYGGFHTQPEFYLNVTNAIEPHPNLVFSIKNVQYDFIRLYPFNSCLGIGKHRQIVEISCNPAGIYGKNAHPYYIGKGVMEGWDEAAWVNIQPKGLQDFSKTKQYAGLWTWARGDGWAGPYIDNELWVDLNVEIFNRFAQNPTRSEEDIFNEVARQRFGVNEIDLPKLRKLCLLSANASLLGQATMYAHVSDWWCRDEFMGAIDLSDIVKAGKTKEALAEKAEAVRMWKTIEALSRQIQLPNKADKEFMEVSCTYGRIKYQIFEQVWIMQLLAAEATINKTPLNKAAMSKALATYDKGWSEWRKLKTDYASCPTLYRDDVAQYCFMPPLKEALDEYRKEVKN